MRVRSHNGLAFFANAESHSLGLGPNTDKACDTAAVWSRHPFNAQVYQAVLLEFALGIEVANQEAALLVLFSNLSHQFDVQCLGKVLDVFAEITSIVIDLSLVFPFIVGPLLLEVEL